MRILAIDYGTKYTGLAISDNNGRTAMPLNTLVASKQHQLMRALEKTIQDFNPVKVVYGNPVNAEGNPTAMSQEISNFMEKLAKKVQLTFISWDERDTSIHAARSFKQNDTRIHSEAARIMLQEYLDHQHAKQSTT